MTTVLLKASPEAIPLKGGRFWQWTPCGGHGARQRARSPHGFITKAISSTSIFTK